jgi:ferredoxin
MTIISTQADLQEGTAARPPRLDDHPTVRAVRARAAGEPAAAPGPLTVAQLREMALAAGADDAGAVSLDHPEVAEEVPHVLKALPGARSLISIVVREHPDDIRSPQRSVANGEFHRVGHETDAIARRLAMALAARGYPTINPSMAFPMEMDDFPGRTWVVSHKRVAVAAQLGRMGLHRSVIHPRFGSFILLGTVVSTAEVIGEAEPLTFNPCLTCKLCVASCPVGAIEPDGEFHFSACYDHNYREFMTGFGDFVEHVAEAGDRFELRDRVSASETASMWQSLAYGPNYKAAHCIAVCPAGEDVIGPFLASRAGFVRDVVRPLTERAEPVYVVAGSDAERHVKKRFPHKPVRVVRSGLRATSAAGLFRSMPHIFQRGPAAGWSATFHFDLSGPDGAQATVRIDDGTLQVQDGLQGTPDLLVRAAATDWLAVVSGRLHPVKAVVTRRLRTRGDVRLLRRFAACFPR